MAIYLKIEKPKTIEELLLQLFTFKGHYHTGTTTYLDEACTQIQCEENKWRSFDDVYELVNTYFPNTDEKEVMRQLLILPLKKDNGIDLYPYFAFCNKINMCTLMVYPSSGANNKDSLTKTKGVGKYAWGDLLEMFDITNTKELQNYIEQNRTKTIKNEETITETV